MYTYYSCSVQTNACSCWMQHKHHIVENGCTTATQKIIELSQCTNMAQTYLPHSTCPQHAYMDGATHASCLSAAPHDVYTIFMAPASALHVFIAPASVVCTFAMNTLIAQWISCILLLFSICSVTRSPIKCSAHLHIASWRLHDFSTAPK